MRLHCPNPDCPEIHFPSPRPRRRGPKIRSIVRKGTFYRSVDRRFIARYHCRSCGKYFSSATGSPEYRQKKRHLNAEIFKLYCSGVSQRRMARLLMVTRRTIVRKFRFLAGQARHQHESWLSTLEPNSILSVQFDDLETFEHTKCKPLSVAIMVKNNTREILGFAVSQMPATGHLSKVSVRKYGPRKDKRHHGWNQLFAGMKPLLHPEALVESDENPHYPKFVKRHLPRARHTRHPGARGAITGQGELKKIRFDPLFSLNHTCAMLRANLNRLFRRTWCTTKNTQGLNDHISLYVRYHNEVLLGSSGVPPN
jgi:hypothetical protein